jgi:LysM repeat protein
MVAAICNERANAETVALQGHCSSGRSRSTLREGTLCGAENESGMSTPDLFATHAPAVRDVLETLERRIREQPVRAAAVGGYFLAFAVMVGILAAPFAGEEAPRTAEPISGPSAAAPTAGPPPAPKPKARAKPSSSDAAARPLPSRAPSASTAAVEESSTIHTVQPGDTLYAIAGRYATTLDELLALNPNLDPYALRSGQEIAVP